VPPRQLCPPVPQWLERVCLRCLDKDPARRPSVAELIQALEPGRAGEEAIEATEVEATDLSRHRRRWSRRGLMAAALVAVISGLALWASLRGGQAGEEENEAAAGGGPPAREVRAPLEASMTVKVFNKPSKPWLSIEQPGSLPVRPDELVRVEVKLNRPAYS